MPPITDTSQITPQWLTRTLTRSKALDCGRVDSFEVKSFESNWANNTRIGVHYSPDSRGERPSSLFLKMVRTEEFGRSEVDFYLKDYVALPDAPIPRCYDAAYSEDPRRYHILMEDLSETHSAVFERTVTEGYALALADACATLHAHWWGADRLQSGGHLLPDESRALAVDARVRTGYPVLLKGVEEEFGDRAAADVRDILDALPSALTARTSDPSSLTLIHGDLSPGNILAPNEGDRPVYFVDRQPFEWSPTVWTGTSDLARVLVLTWEESVRRQFEKTVLERYYDGLLGRGVRGYPWEAFLRDYKMNVAECIYDAADWCSSEESEVERMRRLWTRHAHRVLTAAEDGAVIEALRGV